MKRSERPHKKGRGARSSAVSKGGACHGRCSRSSLETNEERRWCSGKKKTRGHGPSGICFTTGKIVKLYKIKKMQNKRLMSSPCCWITCSLLFLKKRFNVHPKYFCADTVVDRWQFFSLIHGNHKNIYSSLYSFPTYLRLGISKRKLDFSMTKTRLSVIHHIIFSVEFSMMVCLKKH